MIYKIALIFLSFYCSSSYCKVQRDCLFRSKLVLDKTNVRGDKAIPLSGPNINEIDKLNERMELLKKVKRKMEMKSKQQNKNKKNSEKSIEVDNSIKVPLLNIKDSNDSGDMVLIENKNNN